MAAQVFSAGFNPGSGQPSPITFTYTNNTGQNVRIKILQFFIPSGGFSVAINGNQIGSSGLSSTFNIKGEEYAISPGQTFSISSFSVSGYLTYNIIVIPEGG